VRVGGKNLSTTNDSASVRCVKEGGSSSKLLNSESGPK
jgi:hypothetical protein